MDEAITKEQGLTCARAGVLRPLHPRLTATHTLLAPATRRRNAIYNALAVYILYFISPVRSGTPATTLRYVARLGIVIGSLLAAQHLQTHLWMSSVSFSRLT
jgi:hypothetical protein